MSLKIERTGTSKKSHDLMVGLDSCTLIKMGALCTYYIGTTISSISEKSTTRYIRSRCRLFHRTFADTHIVVRWLNQV